MQCTKLADPSSVSALYDRLHSIVAKPVSVERWETRKAVFYKNLPQVLAGIKPPELISPDKLLEAHKKADAAVALNIELQEELDQKEKELIETRKAKSAQDIAVIRQKFSTEMEQYDSLIDECRAALAKLPSIVREALYYEVRREEFIPKEESFEDARTAQEEELLKPARMSDHALVPNDDRPPVRRAQAALSALRPFLEEASSEFFEDATTALGDTPELRRRSYWRAMDLL